jgi:LysR family glycine cleavage system transcriptional activator
MRAPNHLNALRAFEAAARHLSYVAAAEELNVTPAAVGQLVRGLEEVLGVELFRRSPTGPARLVLSDAARRALPDLQAGFERLAAAVERLKATRGKLVITVTVPPAFADQWLLPRVERFRVRNPEFDLTIDTSGHLADFTADGIDVGIRYGAGQWGQLEATRLFADEFFPVCSPAFLESHPGLDRAAHLGGQPLIHDDSMAFDAQFPTWESWLKHANLPTTHCDRGLRLNDSAAVLQAAIAGNGVALGRTRLVAAHLRDGRLLRPCGAAQPFEYAYYVVHRPQRATEAGIAAFKEWLLEEARLDDVSFPTPA